MWELARIGLSAVLAHRLRSALSMLGIAIGVGSVVLLTSIGEGTRRYMLDQFTQFGTNLLVVNPGKSETLGVPGILGGSTHPLTIDDAVAVSRLPWVEDVVPLAFGTARVEAGSLGRSVFVYGVTPSVPAVWKFRVRQGSFWPEGDLRRGAATAVLGPTLERELFGSAPALGEFVRIAGSRFRVIGVMEPKGRMLGFDIDDAVYIPVASAMRIFNLEELTEMDLTFNPGVPSSRVEGLIRSLLTERHGGEEDFTITSQEAMLEVFDNVMDVITMAVGAIAGISLLVGAVGILTMMWIAVGERTGEIGLLRSIGARREEVRFLFLVEAGALSTLGGAAGLAGALAIVWTLRAVVPGLPVHTPMGLAVLALVVSLGVGLLSGVVPAQRAASLDPIEALRAE
jgi:putative ABC transport system permease protein